MTPTPPVAVRIRGCLRVLTAARPNARTALTGLVAALLVGILGMHALASHGDPPAPAAAAVSSLTGVAGLRSGGIAHDAATAMALGGSHDDHDHAAATKQSGAATATGIDSGSGSGHDMTSLVMLCVVMLAAATLTLLVLLAVGSSRPMLPAAFRPAAVRARTVQWVRGTGPPHQWQFSVVRC